ncbi:MAG: tetratricopeptide repeat protein [Acidobacteriaceae bacterium]|nr:tetratricopeptide repeat protein [Acidobacteriaceae bacterium]
MKRYTGREWEAGMLGISSRFLLAIAITGVIGSLPAPLKAQAAAAATEQRQWKDRHEFDLFEAARTGTDANANIDKLDQWKKDYPQTAFQKERRQLYLQNYAKLGKIQDAVNVAKEILGDDPNDFTALYYITLYTPALVPSGATTVPPDVLDQGEKAATGMLANLDKQKPANMADAQWESTKKPIAAVAHTTLGWVAMQRKDNEKAEGEFKQSLASNPANGDVAYWLGIVEAAQKKPEKMPETLFYFARAGNYDGPGKASDGIRQAANQYLDKAYNNYHGSKEGLDQLKTSAKANAAPPADYKIVSVVDLENAKAAQAAEDAKAHPERALYQNIKTELTGANGATYFGSNMKGALLPTLKGKVVKLEPENNPKTVMLSIIDDAGTTADATLKIEGSLPGKVDPGTELSFEGVPDSYTQDPFMVTFTVEPKNVHGWTGKAAAPVRRRPPAKK